jgi:uracil-DNA glycosylase family 4
VREDYALANCYVTNTVKCGVRRGGQHTPAELEACRGLLVRELDLIQPQVVVAVGENAHHTLRTAVLPHVRFPPLLFQITHYPSRRNVRECWDREFPELLRLLARLRPRSEWEQ